MRKRIRARDWAYFPPLGRRSNGGGQAFALYNNVPGGYRATINDNLVLILMIETLAGLKDADRIAKIPGVTAVFAASGDLGNHSGYKQNDPDYEREINIVHDAAHQGGRAAVRALCLGRPSRLHLLPGGQRNRRHRARREGRTGQAGEHPGRCRKSVPGPNRKK